MKKSIFILALFALLMQHAYGRHLSAFFSFSTFDQPGKSPYIETYLNVAGSSVKLAKTAENKFQGKIEVQWVYKQNDKIVHFDKYNLLSPATADTSQPIADFIDQQRVPLANGDYVVELKITDKNTSEQSYTTRQHITINYPQGKINVSDIEFLESYTPTVNVGPFSKNGYDFVPHVQNFFPQSMRTLKFYAEVYNTKEVIGDDDFLVSYNVSGHHNKSIINNLVSYKKHKASAVNIVMGELPIEHVSSGNYNLCIEVRDKSNKLLASRQLLFQRSNPAQKPASTDDLSAMNIENTFVSYLEDKDNLKDYIAALYPVSSQLEVTIEENIMNTDHLVTMQQFFYYFWSKRDPQNPEQAWRDYQAEVNSVNAAFSCLTRKGYETDRGRVYLQYGRPNDVDKNSFDGAAYPYEIWHYNESGEQTNIKFVFMTRNLADNCYSLIHSTAKGEFYDANWLNRLRTESKSNAMGGDADRGDDFSDRAKNIGTKSGGAKDAFDHPK